MAAGRLRHPPLGLSALVVVATAVPLTLLSWLGWRVLDQDRQLEAQQARQRTELAADVAVAEMNKLVVADVQLRLAGHHQAKSVPPKQREEELQLERCEGGPSLLRPNPRIPQEAGGFGVSGRSSGTNRLGP